jgi:hypothetical protein
MLGHMLLCGPLLPVVEEAVPTLEHHIPVTLQMQAANITEVETQLQSFAFLKYSRNFIKFIMFSLLGYTS